MRKVYVAYFKEDTGKFYASEEYEFDKSLSVDDITDEVVRLASGRYKGMHISINFDVGDDIGYPVLVLSKFRN